MPRHVDVAAKSFLVRIKPRDVAAFAGREQPLECGGAVCGELSTSCSPIVAADAVTRTASVTAGVDFVMAFTCAHLGCVQAGARRVGATHQILSRLPGNLAALDLAKRHRPGEPGAEAGEGCDCHKCGAEGVSDFRLRDRPLRRRQRRERLGSSVESSVNSRAVSGWSPREPRTG